MFQWLGNLLLHPTVLVGVGGAIGCNVRYALGIWQKRFVFTTEFPISTTIANLVGSLLMGMIAAKIQDRGSSLYLIGAIGFCGGLTTFSSFALELVEHFQKGRWDRAVAELGINVVIGLVACLVGWKLMHR